MLKTQTDELAIFGGKPAFESVLHVGRPNIGDRQAFGDRVKNILDCGWLTNGGRHVREFEERIADLTGVKHCIAMCNATIALEIAIRALELSGEVIVPSFTFVATAHALQWQGITPIFCDIDPRTYTLDPRQTEQAITQRTTGIMPVHVFGRSCDVNALAEIASRRGLKLLFDSAHAFGCSYRRRMIGNFGNAEVFSFHATKFINSLEGGAVVTNDTNLAEKIRLMKNFGFTGYDQVGYLGTNGKLNEVSAAMGLTNMDSLDDFIAANRRNYEHYREGLARLPGLRLLPFDETEKCNYQYVVIEIDEDQAGISRDQLMDLLHAENVLARRYFYPGCHRMEPYLSYYPEACANLSATKNVVERVLVLPTGAAIEDDEVDRICAIISLALANGLNVGRILRERQLETRRETLRCAPKIEKQSKS